MMTAVLFPEYRQQAFRYARWLVGNECDAEEIVQEAFCKLAQRESDGRPSLTSRSSAALLFTMIRNQSIDVLRRRNARRRVPLSSVAEPASRQSGQDETVELSDLQQSIRQAFEQLPAHWAEALRLRVAGELSYDEIAAVLDCTRNQVRTWIHRARKQLAATLTNQGWLEANTGSEHYEHH